MKIFQDLGADIVTVANNHSLDFGRDAFCDTLATLDQAGITRIGGGYNDTEASAPATRTINGQTFAIFGATRVLSFLDWYATDNQAGIFQTYDPARLNAAIKEAHQTCDHVIVFVHWGIERNETPEDYQRSLAKVILMPELIWWSAATLMCSRALNTTMGFPLSTVLEIIYLEIVMGRRFCWRPPSPMKIHPL